MCIKFAVIGNSRIFATLLKQEAIGRLAQLVQSICLTSRGSAVRIRQRPLPQETYQSFLMRLFFCLHLHPFHAAPAIRFLFFYSLYTNLIVKNNRFGRPPSYQIWNLLFIPMRIYRYAWIKNKLNMLAFSRYKVRFV